MEKFNHHHFDSSLKISFNQYFDIFPLTLNPESEGFDMGCGSGRWSKFIAPRRKTQFNRPSQDALNSAMHLSDL